MEYHAVMKRNEEPTQADIWMNLEVGVLLPE
jgi:hypothetical protein